MLGRADVGSPPPRDARAVWDAPGAGPHAQATSRLHHGPARVPYDAGEESAVVFDALTEAVTDDEITATSEEVGMVIPSAS